MKTVCVYHSIDLDGWMSAAIVKDYFEKERIKLQEEEAERNKGSFSAYPNGELDFIGYNYGQPIPDLTVYDKVIMVDISFPKEDMLKLGDKIIWIDHHISAINSLSEYIPNGDVVDVPSKYGRKGLYNVKYAACELTWQYFFPNQPMPEIVRLLGRYDCFGHKQLWKPVVGYEGLYEVSNHGNIRSLDRTITENNTGKVRFIKGKELSAAISKRGYLVVVLCKDGNETMFNVHNLVATQFIPNNRFKPTVNHKDSNRLNNHASNLEWNTYEENNLHCIKSGNRGKTVVQFNDHGEMIDEFPSIIEAERKTGIQSQNIGKVCKGERDNAGGFRWEYGIDKEKTPQFIAPSEELKVLEFQYGARECISNYEDAYNYLHNCLLQEKPNIIENSIWLNGKSIYQYLCTEAKQSYKNGFTIILPEPDPLYKHPTEKQVLSRSFICINKERFNPINFGIDYHADGYDGAACFHRTNDGKWAFSLYNDNGLVDCSVIAKQYGGGGHKGAAGFVITDINQIIK